ncbi:MAG TPA: hypothetical protein VJI75_06225 [Candidatus Nanoarchaeia archaeon]|nr:hypothetical protein [Candidatus Nanoarchaeia archaeon]
MVLKRRKLCDNKRYTEIILDLVEASQEVNKKTKMEIEQARADIKAGRYFNHGQVKKRLSI